MRRVQYSSLILTDQMTRPEAIDRLKQPPLDPDVARQEFDYVAAKLGITRDELQGCMDLPNRTYRDYRSQDSIYRVGARVMRALGMELGGKR